MKKFLELFIIVLALFSSASALDPKLHDTVVVDRGLMLNFVPEEAFFIVSFDEGGVARVPAKILPPLRKDPMSVNAGMWWFGAKVRVPVGGQVVRSFGFVQGKDNKVAPFGLEVVDLRSGQHFSGSSEKLQEYLQQRHSALIISQRQTSERESELARLRLDAEVIGNFGRIIDARAELARLQRERDGLEKDMRSLEYFIKLASAYPPPRNSIGRIQQLSSQITELADASTRAERGELGRRSLGERDVQHKLQVLEQTRGIDLSDLVDELDRLKSERARLEGRTSARN